MDGVAFERPMAAASVVAVSFMILFVCLYTVCLLCCVVLAFCFVEGGSPNVMCNLM
jgi:hypothetical protein